MPEIKFNLNRPHDCANCMVCVRDQDLCPVESGSDTTVLDEFLRRNKLIPVKPPSQPHQGLPRRGPDGRLLNRR